MAAKLPPYVIWRDGRPRFQPTAREQKLGFRSFDLRHGQGRWYTYEEACDAGWPVYAEILDCRGYDPEQCSTLMAASKAGRTVVLRPSRRPHKRGAAAAGSRPAAPRAPTVQALVEDWLAAIEGETDQDLRLSDDAIESYRKAARAVLYKPETRTEAAKRRKREAAAAVLGQEAAPRPPEDFARVHVSAIDRIALNDFFLYLKRARGHHMAHAAIAAFSAAWEWGTLSRAWRLGHNPRHGLDLPRPEGRIVVFSDAELRALIAAADHLGRASIGDSIMLGVMTSQRQRDRLLLKDEGLVDGRRQFRQSKTGKLVAVKETPQLAGRMADARRRVAELCVSLGLKAEQRPETVVVDERTGRAYVQDTYRNVFAEVRQAAIAGIPDHEATAGARAAGRNDPEPVWLLRPCPSLRFQLDGEWTYKRDQDLRDTAVTWLARAGCTMAEICAITGHSPRSVQTIIEHYLGAARELADSGIDKLTAWFEREGIAVGSSGS